ncbi:MAG: zinc ABC transporter substrate-binding protein [Methanomicrobiales archaeon]|nr:zinc ABC transporter substrate-binding protein [Methanomicrobiales archaeon]
MKSTLILCLCFLGVMLCAGCIQESTPERESKVSVAVGIPPLAEFVEAVGDDWVQVTVILPPGANPHTYEPTPAQIVEISKADLVIAVGSHLPFEDQLLTRLSELRTGQMVVNTSENIVLIDRDPHDWLTPDNANVMVSTITTALCTKDPTHCGTFLSNQDAYQKGLNETDTEIRNTLSTARLTTFLVVHSAWRYFAQDYGMTEIAIEEEGKEPSASRLAKLVETARDEDIRVVFVEPQFSTREAEILAQQINGTVVRLDDLARDYRANLERVARALAEA